MIECNYDVVIIGGGTGGVCAAAAFLKAKYRIAVIEKRDVLGGTTTNGLVSTWAEGVNLDFHIEMFNELSKTGDTMGKLEDSWLPANLSKKGKSNIIKFNPVRIAEYYKSVFDNSPTPNIDIYLNSVFEQVEMQSEKQIGAVFVSAPVGKMKFSAKFFIDASGDGILCRKAAECLCISPEPYYLGRDAKERFNESLAMKENDSSELNEPSLFFRVSNENCNLKQYQCIDSVYAFYQSDHERIKIDDAVFLDDSAFKARNYDLSKIYIERPNYIKVDGYRYSINADGHEVSLCNPMSGAGVTGDEILKYSHDENAQYSFLKKRTQEYWKYIKYSLVLAQRCGKTGYCDHSGWLVSDYTFNITDEFAKICGIRESYRIKCQYMLSQNDMNCDVRTCANIGGERFIAIGCHNIDMHNQKGLSDADIDTFNKQYLRPYGIRYDCFVPDFLSNVLVGCKAFGASQLAVSSARIVKTISQIGWGCGNAIRLCLDKNKSDTALDDSLIPILQSEQYTNFIKSYSIIKDQ